MIDITAGEPQAISTRQKMHKNFDVDVTIKEETHNLEIDVFHTEDIDGGNAELDSIQMSGYTFSIAGPKTMDISEEIHNHLDSWFGDNFEELTVEETKEDFDEIFAQIWDYIEEKDLY